MEISTAMVVAVVLLVGLWGTGPHLVDPSQKSLCGYTWFNWWKPRGAPDTVLEDLAEPPSRLDLASSSSAGRPIAEIAPHQSGVDAPPRPRRKPSACVNSGESSTG